MAVITGIVRAVEIGRKIYQVQRRVDKRLQSVSPANQFINRYAPPGSRRLLKKAYRYGEIALGGKLIYDLISQGMKQDGISPTDSKRSQYRKTRTNIFKSKFRQRSRNKFHPCYRRRRF